MSAQRSIAQSDIAGDSNAGDVSAISETRRGAGIDEGTTSVGPARSSAKLSDAWDGRFLSDPQRYRRALAKLFQRSYPERDERGLETGRTLTSVPYAEIAECTSSSSTTARRAIDFYVKRGVLELVSEGARRDEEHRSKRGRFVKERSSGSNTGKPHVFAIHVKSEDELAVRRSAVRSMHRAWGPELAGFSSADREIFAWLLAHANYGGDRPELRDLAWPSIDGRHAKQRGRGALCERSKLSRATAYRSIQRLIEGGKIEKVMLRKASRFGSVVGLFQEGDRFSCRGWRILPPPFERPSLASGRVGLRRNPGQNETSTPVTVRHEDGVSEGSAPKGGTPVESASTSSTSAERSSSAGHTSASPTGTEDKPRSGEGLPVAAHRTAPESNSKGTRAHAVPLRAPSPVQKVLFAAARIFAPGVCPDDYARDFARQKCAARALSWATPRSKSGRFTPELVIEALERVPFDDHYRTRPRLTYILNSAEHLEELLDDERPAARAARAARRQVVAAAGVTDRGRGRSQPTPFSKIDTPLRRDAIDGSAAHWKERVERRAKASKIAPPGSPNVLSLFDPPPKF